MMKTLLFLFAFLATFLVQAQDKCCISGTIRDVRTQNELSSVSIKISRNDTLLSDFMSNEKGEFSVSNLPAGSYELEFNKLKYKPLKDTLNMYAGLTKYPRIFLISEDDTLTSPGQISTDPGKIRGVVTDSTAKELVPFGTVKVFKDSTLVHGVYVDLDGLYNITDLKPGTYRLVYENVGYDIYTVEDVEVIAGEVIYINISLTEEKLPEVPIIQYKHTGVE